MLNEYKKVIDLTGCHVNNAKELFPKNIVGPILNFNLNVYNIDGTLYYGKRIWSRDEEDCLVHELIGSYLSKLIDLEAVDYKIAMGDGYVVILSKLFYDNDFDYEYVDKYNSNFIIKDTDKLFLIDNIPSKSPLKEKILKLILLDLKMGQYDRCNETNIMLKKSKITNFVDLAPVYDFSFSYPILTSFTADSFLYYTNYYLTIAKNEASLKQFIKQYPESYNTLYILANTMMDKVIKDIEEENELIVGKEIKANILKQDSDYSMLLKKAL